MVGECVLVVVDVLRYAMGWRLWMLLENNVRASARSETALFQVHFTHFAPAFEQLSHVKEY
jgi:hypothetical protein